MANQLTLRVMETIVKRCEGYEPLSEGTVNTTSQNSGITQREEALLSSVIHRQTEVSSRMEVSGMTDAGGRTEAGSRQSHQGSSFTKNGVVNLDALLRELKK